SLHMFLTLSPSSPVSPLSLHDALPIFRRQFSQLVTDLRAELERASEPAIAVADSATLRQKINRVYETLYAGYDWPHLERVFDAIDRKSTRLNSSHVKISYAVFCLKKKK